MRLVNSSTLWMVALAVGSSIAPATAGAEEAVLTIDSVVLHPLVEAETPARQTGVLARIVVAEGAAVEAGAVLASLDERAATLAVKKAELERDQAAAKLHNTLAIEYADKALAVARAELRRSQESNEKFPSSISDSQLDVERLTVEKLQLERKQKEHELELQNFDLRLKQNALDAAQLELQLHVVRAPFAGVVSLVRARAGEWVQPGTPVLRMVAVDKLRAEGFAPADSMVEAMTGATVRFALENADEAPWEGRLAFVSPEVDPVARQVRIWAEIDNSQRKLRPGQQGRLLIPLD
jgi:macrolide-specific efflux system membrane fusion protein